jgi:hypothetical protein
MLARVLNILLWAFVASFVLGLILVAGLSLSMMGAGAVMEDHARDMMTRLNAQ